MCATKKRSCDEVLNIVSLILRTGLAFVFLYAGIAALGDPGSWIIYMPAFLQQLVPGPALLGGFSVLQIILALWLLTGKALGYAALIALLFLTGIIVFNLFIFAVIFRDVAIWCSAAALMVIGWNERISTSQ